MKRRSILRGIAATSLVHGVPALGASPAPGSPAPRPGPAVALTGDRLVLLDSTVRRLVALRRLVGYGNFNLLGFDDGLRYARNHGRVGAFTRAEKAFLEEMFLADARAYGFFGNKVFDHIGARVSRKDVVKIPGSGHYLYKGESLALYRRLRREVGSSLVLTSGVRGMVKQMHLFLAKAVATRGDLSRASRSLAPPGHSYHGVGDFDVGKRGLGARNFSDDFARTDEFRRLVGLGYVVIRYPHGNPFGVRFEPWHIKVV